MMMIVILDKTLRVLVVFVKFKIEEIEDYELVAPILIDRIDEVKHTLPALLTSATEKYAYRDAAELKAAFRSATKDTISGSLFPITYYRYVYKVFRAVGFVENQSEFNSLLNEYKELAQYIKENKNEIY